MAGVEGQSEYEGGGVMPNTVFPKGTEALTASDKLRLQSITGQEEDSRAPVDPYFWQGGTKEEVKGYLQDVNRDGALRRREAAARDKQARDRYKESPY